MKTDRESTIRRSEPDLTLILAISDGQFLNTSDNPLPHKFYFQKCRDPARVLIINITWVMIDKFTKQRADILKLPAASTSPGRGVRPLAPYVS